VDNSEEQQQGRPVTLIAGASSGVGRALATLLAESGHDLALVARREDELKRTATLARQERSDGGGRIEVFAIDLCDAEAVRALPGQVVEQMGRLDAIANVAGMAPLNSPKDTTSQLWRDCIDTNLSYIVNIAATAWPIFAQQKSGIFVNVSSMAAKDPFPGFSAYAAAKAGVNTFTYCLAKEGKRAGIRAVAVAPGAIETPMLRQNFDQKMLPVDRTLDPAEVAGVIRDCITGQREFDPGQVIWLPSQ
jgi:NAD(P)-dependent dehydrogenase (short-subunit alcohol dehydrogenase family)